MIFVGEILKKQRLSKKISLNKISTELKISKNILEKIENDQFDETMENVYFIGHIRSYAVFLKLNSDVVVEQFKIQNSLKNVKIQNYIAKPKIEKSIFVLNKLFSFILILIIFLSFYFLFIDVKKPETDFALIPDIPENLQPVIEKELVETELKDLVKKNEEPPIFDFESISSSSVIASSNNFQEIINEETVTLKFLNPVWIQIRNNSDSIVISQLMNKNDEYSYDLNLNYAITAGNAGNILVLINNNIRGKIGEFGEVLDSVIINSNFSN